MLACPEMSWYKRQKDGSIFLFIWLQPNAKKTEISGLFGQPPSLKIRVASPPIDGKANRELLQFLTNFLKLPKKALEITQGEASRRKTVRILGNVDTVTALLSKLMADS